jgi:hypothetical protein
LSPRVVSRSASLGDPGLSTVKKRYGNGAEIPTVPRETLLILGVDEQQIFVRGHLWQAALQREHLEKAVQLIEQGLDFPGP